MLLNRLICSKCNKIYNLKNFPPKKEGICDQCGEKLVARKDDNEETIRRRLEIYHKDTVPVISFYRDRDLLQVVAGNAAMEEVTDSLKAIIENN